MKNTQNSLKVVIGLILMVLYAVLFMVDRCIMVFLPHMEQTNIQKFIFSPKKVFEALIRLSAVLFIVLLWLLISNRIK